MDAKKDTMQYCIILNLFYMSTFMTCPLLYYDSFLFFSPIFSFFFGFFGSFWESFLSICWQCGMMRERHLYQEGTVKFWLLYLVVFSSGGVHGSSCEIKSTMTVKINHLVYLVNGHWIKIRLTKILSKATIQYSCIKKLIL